MLIFEVSRSGRNNPAQAPLGSAGYQPIPERFRRCTPLRLPEVSELQAVRHYTRLSQQNFSIDTHFYPLGSCTMKYNPRGAHKAASLSGFINRHPYAPEQSSQGVLACLYELQQMLAIITGMQGISLAPMAGAQGEFAGLSMIRAYHLDQGDHQRQEIIVPDAAHGTNPATANLCGFTVREIPTDAQGDVNIQVLKKVVGPRTAGIMLTNPSTLGVFERRIEQIARIVHEVGGLLYYDGANLNAILGKVRPGDMGFDAIHVNLHKTFATPHGGGGPGAGPVGVGARLLPYLPVPLVEQVDTGYRLLEESERPQSIGRLSAFMGNVGVLLHAYAYLRLLGRQGLPRVAEYATLNANYLARRLAEAGFDLAYPDRRPMHEFVLTLKREAQETGVTALDYAKRLLDYGMYAPTIYFPLLVAESMLIEPTETEDKETLDAFVAAMIAIRNAARSTPEIVKTAPHKFSSRRFDEVNAARHPDLRWSEGLPGNQLISKHR